MPTTIALGHRGDLDQALQRRGLNPYSIVPATANPPESRRLEFVTDMENAQEIPRAVFYARIHDAAGALGVDGMSVCGAACLRQRLNPPGNADSERVLHFRDTALQKSSSPPQARRARCRYASRGTAFTDLVDELGDVLVIKRPTGNVTSTSVSRSVKSRPGRWVTAHRSASTGTCFPRRSGSREPTPRDAERNFLFDKLASTPGAPLGPYGRVGEAIVSGQDELENRGKRSRTSRASTRPAMDSGRTSRAVSLRRVFPDGMASAPGILPASGHGNAPDGPRDGPEPTGSVHLGHIRSMAPCRAPSRATA